MMLVGYSSIANQAQPTPVWIVTGVGWGCVHFSANLLSVFFGNTNTEILVTNF